MSRGNRPPNFRQIDGVEVCFVCSISFSVSPRGRTQKYMSKLKVKNIMSKTYLWRFSGTLNTALVNADARMSHGEKLTGANNSSGFFGGQRVR